MGRSLVCASGDSDISASCEIIRAVISGCSSVDSRFLTEAVRFPLFGSFGSPEEGAVRLRERSADASASGELSSCGSAIDVLSSIREGSGRITR